MCTHHESMFCWKSLKLDGTVIQCQVTEICHLNNVIDEPIENVSIIYSYRKSYRIFSNNQTNIYLFKINDRNTRKICEMCSKLKIKIRIPDVFN